MPNMKWWSDFGSKIGSADSFSRKHVRIYGALRQCSGADWWKAITELFITLVFALFALWVPLIVLPMFGILSASWSELIYSQIKNGELYILTTGLLAPVFYFTFPNARAGLTTEARHFPSQQIIILVFIGTIVVSVLAIAATKIQTVDASTAANTASHTRIPARMISWSVWLFAFTTVLYFLTLAVRNWLERGGVDQVLDQQSREQDARTPPPEQEGTAGAAPHDPDAWIDRTIAEHTVKPDAA